MRLLLLLTLLLIINTGYGGNLIATDSTSATALYEKGNENFKSASYDKAFVLFDLAAKSYLDIADWTGFTKSQIALNKIRTSRHEFDSANVMMDSIFALIEKKLGSKQEITASAINLKAHLEETQGHFETALKNYNESLSFLKKDFPANDDVGDNLLSIARIYRLRSQFDNAFQFAEEAEQFFASNDSDKVNIARVMIEKAVITKNLGQYDDALTIYYDVEKILLEELGEENNYLADVYNGIGIIHAQSVRYPQALAYFRRLLNLDLKLLGDDHPSMAKTYTNLGILHELMGDYDGAIDYHNKALRIKLKRLPNDHPSLRYDYMGLAIVYNLKADNEQCILFANQALQIMLKENGKMNPQLVAVYNLLGSSYRAKNEMDKGLEFLLQAEELWTLTGASSPQIGPVYHNLSAAFRDMGDYAKAIDYANKAIDQNVRFYGNQHFFVAENYINLGSLFQDKNDYQNALVNYQKANEISEGIFGKRNHNSVIALIHMAEIYFLQDRLDESLATIQQATIAASNSFDLNDFTQNPSIEDGIKELTLIRALAAKGQILFQIYQTANEKDKLLVALETYELAIKLIDNIKVGYKAKSSFLTFRENINPVFELSINVAHELYQLEKDKKYLDIAFSFAERGKNTLLMASLQDSKAKDFTNIPEALLVKERDLKRNLIYFEQQLFEAEHESQTVDSSNVASLQNNLFQLKGEYDSLVYKMEQQYPDYYNLKYASKIIIRQDIQQNMLDDKEWLIEYYEGDSSLFVFAFTNEQEQFIRLKKPKGFRDDVLKLRNLIVTKDYDVAAFSNFSYELYKTLIHPIGIPEEQQRLYVIPDGMLSFIPFEVLITGTPEGEYDFSQLPYLLKTFQINYALSASLLSEMLDQTQSESSDELLAFAPQFGENNDVTGTAGDQNFELIAFTDTYRNSLVPLPGAAFEVNSIDKLIHGVLYEGEDASEFIFKRDASDYGIIHLATHAIIDDKYPMNSRLMFAIDNDSTDDGSLYAWELYNMKLNAQLAVLSACNTGVGQLRRGEGVMSLGRAFLYAGCPSIVMSLWTVQDNSTAEIMTDFYGGLAKNNPKDEALRMAKIKYVEESPSFLAHPFYWAGFVAQGNPNPIELKAKFNYLLLLVIPVLLLFIFYGTKKKRPV